MEITETYLEPVTEFVKFAARLVEKKEDYAKSKRLSGVFSYPNISLEWIAQLYFQYLEFERELISSNYTKEEVLEKFFEKLWNS